MANSFFILEKERPKLQKLKNLLELNLYFGEAADENNDTLKVRKQLGSKLILCVLIILPMRLFSTQSKTFSMPFSRVKRRCILI